MIQSSSFSLGEDLRWVGGIIGWGPFRTMSGSTGRSFSGCSMSRAKTLGSPSSLIGFLVVYNQFRPLASDQFRLLGWGVIGLDFCWLVKIVVVDLAPTGGEV